MTPPITAIVYTKNKTLSEGLTALLESMPEIQGVIQEVEFKSVFQIVTQSDSALLVVDASLFTITESANITNQELIKCLQKVKSLTPSVAALVLVDSIEQQQALEGDFGIDSVILKGFPAVEFLEVIEEMLQKK
jgi:DNA-binding NarL/FixJ family response regulator